MNEQLKNLVWELDRRIWASVTNGEATASWGRQESAKMIEEYASEQNAQLRKEWEAYHKKTLEEQWELAEETITKLRERIKFLQPLSEGNFEQANELNDQDQTIAQLRKDLKAVLETTESDKDVIIIERAFEMDRLRKEVEEYKVVVKNYDKIGSEKTETITRLRELVTQYLDNSTSDNAYGADVRDRIFNEKTLSHERRNQKED